MQRMQYGTQCSTPMHNATEMQVLPRVVCQYETSQMVLSQIEIGLRAEP